jgi:hypothetical protein
MNREIDRRLGALEYKTNSGVQFILILRRLVSPGNTGTKEITAASLRGERYTRNLGETESDFIERLRGLAISKRGPGEQGASVLIDETDIAI